MHLSSFSSRLGDLFAVVAVACVVGFQVEKWISWLTPKKNDADVASYFDEDADEDGT